MYLYHYTTISALFGIIKNKEWWFGSFQSANDKSELINYIEGLKKSVLRKIDDDKNKRKCLSFFEKINPYNDLTFYMSLSSLSDNANLWDRYSSQATGICLKLNKKVLIKAFKEDFFIDKVYYRNTFNNHEHKEIIYSYIVNDLFEKGFSAEEQLISNIQSTSCRYKHPSFKGENETRLVAILPKTLCSNALSYAKCEYKLIGNIVKQVLVLNLESYLSKNNLLIEDLIEKIVIAPKSNQEMQTIKNLLTTNGLHKLAKNVKLSECPLR